MQIMPGENETSKEQELADFVLKNVNEIKRLISKKQPYLPTRIPLDFLHILMSFDARSFSKSHTLNMIANQIKQFLSVSDTPIQTNENQQIFTTNQEGVTFVVTLDATKKTPVGRGEIVVEPINS